MMKIYDLEFTVSKKVEAYSEEQIKDLLSLAIGKALSEAFGLSTERSQIEITKLVEVPDED